MKNLLLLLALPFIFAACGDDDEASFDKEELIESYNNLRMNIVGSWVMDAYYKESTSNPYIKLGWNENDEYGFFESNELYEINFTENIITTHKGKTSVYKIELNYDTPYYTNTKSPDYWPFKSGKIKFSYNFGYEVERLLEIKKDGKLYLYTELGIPDLRFRRK